MTTSPIFTNESASAKPIVSPEAKRQNLIYLIFVGSLIILSIIIPPPFGSLAGLITATVLIVYGIVIRNKMKKKNPSDSIAKTGLIISIFWFLWNLLILTLAVFVFGLIALITGLIQAIF